MTAGQRPEQTEEQAKSQQLVHLAAMFILPRWTAVHSCHLTQSSYMKKHFGNHLTYQRIVHTINPTGPLGGHTQVIVYDIAHESFER